MYILHLLFALMQVAISKGNATELSTAAGMDALPNLSVVISDLGCCYIEPYNYNHVRVRICPDDMKLRFIIENIIHDKTQIPQINLENFWDNCPYGQQNPLYPWGWEIDYSEAEQLLLWTLQRGQDINCTDILANIWAIA